MKAIHLSIAITSLIATSATFTQSEDSTKEAPLNGKLIMVQNAANLPDLKDIYRIKPMGYKEGITLHFVVQAEGIISFDRYSLKAEGWKFGSFPRVSEDGKTATFSIFKAGNLLGKKEEEKAQGTVEVLTGDAPVTKTLTLKEGAEPQELAGCKITLQATKEGFTGTGVKATGKFGNIKQVEIKQNGKLTKSNGWVGMKDMRVYSFKDIKDEVEVVITYWPNTKPQTVTFSTK